MISTHSLGLAKELCERGILLDRGKLELDGEIGDVIRRYSDITD